MRLPTTAFAVLWLALTCTLNASRAEAQVLTAYGSWNANGETYPGTTSYGETYPGTTSYYLPSYSYWTAAYYGYPPRVYSGYGSNDFPYYGRAYGSPSDPWSWPAMAGYSYAVPTRYNLYP